MQLEFTTDQEELRDAVRDVLTNESPVSLARSIVEDGTRPDALWKTMVDLGWPALTIAERHGGLGLGFVEAGIVAEELGRVIASGPWLSTVTQLVPVIEECATAQQRSRLLPQVASGELTGTLAIAEPDGSFDPAHTTATLTPDGSGFRLTGAKRFVVEGDYADVVAVAARIAGTEGTDGCTVALVRREAVEPTPVDSIDQSVDLADITFTEVEVGPDDVLGSPGDAASGLARALHAATVGVALELVGTCQTIFDVTLDYAKQREQFGVPIGSFQAVKHKLADMFVALERARATSYFAALTIAEDDERRTTASSVAKAAAGDCQRRLAKEGIQLHGGIGFTWEHDMHLYVKRCKGAEPLFGNASWHRQRIAAQLGL